MKKVFRLLLLLALLAGGVLALLHWQSREAAQDEALSGVTGVNGRLEMRRVDVASLHGGRILSVSVDEGDHVARDSVLAVIASDTIPARIRALEAARSAALENAAKQDSRLREADREIALASLELEDARKLYRDRLIAKTELERRITALGVRQDRRKIIERERRQAGFEAERIGAQLEEIRISLEEMTVRSPFDGYVEYRLADPGNVIPAGGRVISLLDPSDVFLDIFLPAMTAAGVSVGDEGRIVIDGVEGAFPARITYVARDAQFTPKFVETREERAKLLFRVRLKIAPHLALEHKDLFRGGMPAVGYVLHRGSVWPPALAIGASRQDPVSSSGISPLAATGESGQLPAGTDGGDPSRNSAGSSGGDEAPGADPAGGDGHR